MMQQAVAKNDVVTGLRQAALRQFAVDEIQSRAPFRFDGVRGVVDHEFGTVDRIDRA